MIKTRIDSIFVRVDIPAPWLSKNETQWLADARDVAAQIERHVDDIGSVEVVAERSSHCEFCGHPWADSCCNESIAEIAARERVEFGL